jgi:hypothetical protein
MTDAVNNLAERFIATARLREFDLSTQLVALLRMHADVPNVLSYPPAAQCQ